MLEDLYMISQVVAAFAVMGSLIFVGLQMRQSDKTQRAIMHQSRTDRAIDIGFCAMEPHNLSMTTKAREEGINLTAKERSHLGMFLRIGLLNMEEIVWQHGAGMLDGDVLEDQRRAMRQMFTNPVNRALWKHSRSRYPDTFANHVDNIISATPVQAFSPDQDEVWAKLLNSEMAD